MHPSQTRLLTACLAAALLAACSAPEPQAPPAQTPDSPDAAENATQTPAPGDTATPTAPEEPPMGKRSPGQENDPVQAYRAFGNEPFWSVRVDGDTLVFSTPEDQPGKTMHGRRVPSLRGVSYQGKDGDVDFNLDIQTAECNDGMSDNEYTLESTFVYGGTTYRGCAEAAK